MRVILFIVAIAVVAAVLYGLVLIGANVIESIQTKRDATIKRLTKERDDLEKHLRVAEKGLRKIANGISGNPPLDAQIILDDMDNVKELT